VNVNDELIDEQNADALFPLQQSELISRYCSAFADQLAFCRSRSEAKEHAAKLCSEFEAECASSVLRSTVRSRVDILIYEKWGSG
jgi:hypothetical protein